jgi:hypothetical protein
LSPLLILSLNYRELYPALLRKSDRGKHHNPNALPANYGQQHVASGVEGVELLEAYERGDIKMNSDGEHSTAHTSFICDFLTRVPALPFLLYR